MSLAPAEKCAVYYIKDACDNVGVWIPNFALAEFTIGAQINWEALPGKMNGNVRILDNGKWWLCDFCEFQYGELNAKCRPHQSYLHLLEKHGLKGYVKGIHTHKEKDKEKDKDKELDKDKDKNIVPFDRHVYHLFEKAFTSKNTDFDFRREGKHLQQLEQKALARDSPDEFAKRVLVTFWRMVHSNDKFYRAQPFLPSTLNAGGIWPRVLKQLENESAADDLDDEIARVFG